MNCKKKAKVTQRRRVLMISVYEAINLYYYGVGGRIKLKYLRELVRTEEIPLLCLQETKKNH